MIETTEDIAEQIADWIGVYGACKSETGNCDSYGAPFCCRILFVESLLTRMRDAAVIDMKLGLDK